MRRLDHWLRVAGKPDPHADLGLVLAEEAHSLDRLVVDHDRDVIAHRADDLDQCSTCLAALGECERIIDVERHGSGHRVEGLLDRDDRGIPVGGRDLGAPVAHHPGRVGRETVELGSRGSDAVGADANATGDEHVFATLLVATAHRAARRGSGDGSGERSPHRPVLHRGEARPDVRLRSSTLSVAPAQLQHLLAHGGGDDVERLQDAGRHAGALGEDAEQDVLRADAGVVHRQRLTQRQFQHLLGARRERDVP